MAAAGEDRSHRVDVAPSDAIDDAGLAAMTAEHLLDLRHFIAPRNDAIGEIRPVEVADQLDVVAKPELLGDVAPHAFGGGGGERVQRRLRKELAQLAELAVFRTKIVTPLADAMRLIDRERGHARAA